MFKFNEAILLTHIPIDSFFLTYYSHFKSRILISLELFKNKNEFFPGDYVTGAIRIKIKNSEHFHNIDPVVKILGLDLNLRLKAIERSFKKEVDKKGKIKEIESKLHIWHNETFKFSYKMNLRNGEYYQPFSIKLDLLLPPSIIIDLKDKCFFFEWTIEADVKLNYISSNENFHHPKHFKYKIKSCQLSLFIKDDKQFWDPKRVDQKYILNSGNFIENIRSSLNKIEKSVQNKEKNNDNAFFNVEINKDSFLTLQNINIVLNQKNCKKFLNEIQFDLIFRIKDKSHFFVQDKEIIIQSKKKSFLNENFSEDENNFSFKIENNENILTSNYFGKVFEATYVLKIMTSKKNYNLFETVSSIFCSKNCSKSKISEIELKIYPDYNFWTYNNNFKLKSIPEVSDNEEDSKYPFSLTEKNFTMKNINIKAFGFSNKNHEKKMIKNIKKRMKNRRDFEISSPKKIFCVKYIPFEVIEETKKKLRIYIKNVSIFVK